MMLRPWLACVVALFLVGCGGGGAGFDSGTDLDASDATVGLDGDCILGCSDATPPDAPSCTGLQCQQTCPTGTITGTVYDPALINGLYNVFVYVPNAPLNPITDGPVCTSCQAPASGNPITSTTTDAKGTFTLTNPPIGTNIPLILQLGKWRRHITLANVTCGGNVQPDKSLRFPIKQHEGSPDDNIPLIAFTQGCDGAECFFAKRLGIDPSQFTDGKGTGRVRIYPSPNYTYAGTFPGVTTSSPNSTYLFNTTGEMMKYDIVFDACECSTFDRGGAGSTNTGYKNFLAYLNAGGRTFSTHYYYNFFADTAQCFSDTTCQGQSPLPTTGAWEGNTGQQYSTTGCPNTGSYPTCLNIDTAIPKGKAFADWYSNNNPKIAPAWGGEKYGFVGLTDIRNDMGPLSSSLLTAGTATPWLFADTSAPAEPMTGSMPTTGYDAYYFSINTPVGTNPATQCGRAVFSDVHLNAGTTGTFPSYCSPTNTDSHAPNDLALEFLFFDLSSCVQNDTQPPPPPPH